MQFEQDQAFLSTPAFAHQLLAAVRTDDMPLLLKRLALTDNVLAAASAIVPGVTPRLLPRDAAALVFPPTPPTHTPPAPTPGGGGGAAAAGGGSSSSSSSRVGATDEPRKEVPLLHLACALGKAACVELMLALGVPANWQIEGYVAPLHIACHLKHVDICKLLIAKGASMEVG